MRLTEEQKAVVLASRHGSTLARVGEFWAVVWKDQSAPVCERWHAQLVHHVEAYSDVDTATTLQRVWWAGGEVITATRHEAMAGIAKELP